MVGPQNTSSNWLAPSGSDVHLRLLATTDLHANLLPFDYLTDRVRPGIGLARLMPLIAAARETAPNTLLFDNGDTLQGTPLADAALQNGTKLTRPHPMHVAMNALGFDAATLGNHDFDFGIDVLETALGHVTFPHVLANMERVGAATPWQSRLILTRTVTDQSGQTHTLRIGVTGATPPQVAAWNQKVLEGQVALKPIVPTITKEVAALKSEGADLIVVLAHSGPGPDHDAARGENTAAELAEMDGVDAVIAGHTHIVYPQTDMAHSAAPMVQPGAMGSHLGQIDLCLARENGKWHVRGHRAQALPSIAAPPAHKHTRRIFSGQPDLRAAIERDHRATRDFASRPLGQTAVALETYFSLVAPCAATQIVADAQLAAATDLVAKDKALAHLPLLSAVAPFKAGGLGGADSVSDIPPGPLRLRHAADLYLYPNLLSVLKVTGAGVRRWLERAASVFQQIDPNAPAPQSLLKEDAAAYNFDRITGLLYEIDLSQSAQTNVDGDVQWTGPGRIGDLHLPSGERLQDTDEVLVVTNSYRASGGGLFRGAMEAEDVVDAQLSVRDALVGYIQSAPGPITPRLDPNWTFRPLGGAKAILQTGAGALSYADRARALGLRRTNTQTSDDIVEFEVTI